MGDRRPIAMRDLAISKRVASRLADRGWSPNAISVAGMFAGIAAGLAFWSTSLLGEWWRPAFLAGAVLTQLRLLANMLDGMVAVDTGKESPVGELYNEVPDRVSDVAILVGLGYAVQGSPALGWIAALAAVLTAYVRAQVAVAGAPQDFCGPLAKPQRMFLVTITSLYCSVMPAEMSPTLASGPGLPALCLLVIAVGGLVTALRRLSRGARFLRSPT